MCYIPYKIAKILYQYYIHTAGPLHFFCRIPRTYSHSTILFSLGKLHTVPPPHGFLLQPSPSLGEFRDDTSRFSSDGQIELSAHHIYHDKQFSPVPILWEDFSVGSI